MSLNFQSNSLLPTSPTITCFLEYPINFIPFKNFLNIRCHFRIKRIKQKDIISKVVNSDDFTLLDWNNNFNVDESVQTIQPRNLWFGLLEIYEKDWFKSKTMIPTSDNKWTDIHISQNSKIIMDLLLTFNHKISKKRGITFTFVNKNQDDSDGYQYFFGINKKEFSLKHFNKNRKWCIALQSLSKDIIDLENIEWTTDLLPFAVKR